MAESDSIQSSWSAEEKMDLEQALMNGATTTLAKQLLLSEGSIANSESPTIKFAELPNGLTAMDSHSRELSEYEPEQESAVELHELRSIVPKQVERIHNLEQALDQALAFVEELRRRLVNQEFLENQLASTEDIANVQQQAITHLKQQLAQQQQALEAQKTQTYEQSQSFHNLLEVLEDLAEEQQTRLMQLKTKTQDDRSQSTLQADTANTASNDPSEIADHDRIQELMLHLSNRQADVDQLETELHRAHIALEEQQAFIGGLQQTHLTQGAADENSSDELFNAHCKIQDLETQISRYITTHAILQHTCQELEQARDRYQTRAVELEHQSVEMQEQILKQAQQASEYETAIQHWKDRYVKSQDYLKRLKDAIERIIPNPTDELADLIAAIQTIVDASDPDNATAIVNLSKKIDIPDFLARRQRYRARS